MGFYNAFGDRHAEPGTAGLGRIKWLKDALPLFGGQPRAVIIEPDAQPGLPVEVRLGAIDLDFGGIATGGKGVLQNISKYPLDAERLDGLRPENLLSLQTHRAKQDPSWLVVPDPKSR